MNAILVPYQASSSNKGAHYTDHGEVEAHYPGPSGHEEVYHGDSSGPGYDYHQAPVETHHHEHQHPYHEEGAGGLLILRKVANTHQHQESYHQQEQHVHPRQSASASSIFSKLLSASSSLDPHKPDLYGDNYEHDGDNELASAPSEHKPREVVQSLKPAKQQSFINQLLPTQKPLSEENSHKYGGINQLLLTQKPLSEENSHKYGINQLLPTQKPLSEENGYKYGSQFVEPAVRPLSLYLESPKLEYLQPTPNDTGSNLEYLVSPLGELGPEQQQAPSNQPYFYKYQTSQEMSIVPSISYEIKQNARRRIT
ncbi:unnamed protein product [Phyllotreta striolata]|uniref:Uncharacterized protein n=1 Tax=Phyllotreta striolata TaxID=444603 RepID=A0A9N9TM33_PHYSR|nr:unnamed protein product [Phyllotreta striolata]